MQMPKLLFLLAIVCAFASFAFYTANDAVGDVPNWASTVCTAAPALCHRPRETAIAAAVLAGLWILVPVLCSRLERRVSAGWPDKTAAYQGAMPLHQRAMAVLNTAPLMFNVSPDRPRPPTPARSGLNSRHEPPSVPPPGGFALAIRHERGASVAAGPVN